MAIVQVKFVAAVWGLASGVWPLSVLYTQLGRHKRGSWFLGEKHLHGEDQVKENRPRYTIEETQQVP